MPDVPPMMRMVFIDTDIMVAGSDDAMSRQYGWVL
jgi:hypothetical protein